ncbi:hypothetical protein D3C76_1490260 [compost metagenome]
MAACTPALPLARRTFTPTIGCSARYCRTASTTLFRVLALWSARYRLTGSKLQSALYSRSPSGTWRTASPSDSSSAGSATHFGLPSLTPEAESLVSTGNDCAERTPGTLARYQVSRSM